MNKVGNMLVGFLAGATAGIVTGILVAPYKGEKTRKILKMKVNDATKEIKDITDKIGEKIDVLESKVGNLKRKIDHGAETMKESASKAGPDAKTAVKTD